LISTPAGAILVLRGKSELLFIYSIHIGSFTEGNYADLAIFSDGYLIMPDQRIRKIESMLALIGG